MVTLNYFSFILDKPINEWKIKEFDVSEILLTLSHRKVEAKSVWILMSICSGCLASQGLSISQYITGVLVKEKAFLLFRKCLHHGFYFMWGLICSCLFAHPWYLNFTFLYKCQFDLKNKYDILKIVCIICQWIKHLCLLYTHVYQPLTIH